MQADVNFYVIKRTRKHAYHSQSHCGANILKPTSKWWQQSHCNTASLLNKPLGQNLSYRNPQQSLHPIKSELQLGSNLSQGHHCTKDFMFGTYVFFHCLNCLQLLADSKACLGHKLTCCSPASTVSGRSSIKRGVKSCDVSAPRLWDAYIWHVSRWL